MTRLGRMVTGSLISGSLVLVLGFAVWAEEKAPATPAAEEEGHAVPAGPEEDRPPLAGPRPFFQRLREARQRGSEGRRGAASRPYRPMDDRGRFSRDRGGRGPMRPERDPEMLELPELTEESIDAFLERVEQNFPELHEKLIRLRSEDEEGFMRMAERVRNFMIDQMGPRGRGLRQEHFEKMREIQRKGRQYRAATTDEEKSRLKSEIRATMEGLFEDRVSHHRREIEELEARLAEMKRRIAQVEANKETLLDEQLQNVLEGRGMMPPRGEHGPGRRGFRDGPPHIAPGPPRDPRGPRRPPE